LSGESRGSLSSVRRIARLRGRRRRQAGKPHIALLPAERQARASKNALTRYGVADSIGNRRGLNFRACAGAQKGQ
jgi:hypothetical protein